MGLAAGKQSKNPSETRSSCSVKVATMEVVAGSWGTQYHLFQNFLFH